MHVLATAGHVDHGKSTLVRMLTGIDPDRLPEEKQRGLTIDLGFAWMRLPSGREIGMVDVPGHERFIHTMLAGAGSVDGAILVVAATEGWMPQSEEHLAILEMLGVRGGVVALTKADLVDADALDAVGAQIRGRLAGTPLAAAPVVAVSAIDGSGAQDLVVAIDRMVDALGEPTDRARPRMFIDRVFTVTGVGTVATGTLTGGTLRTGDAVTILPSGRRARIRGIQSHRTVHTEATPIRRVALNLAGVSHDEVARGDAVVAPDQWHPASELDVHLQAVRGIGHTIATRGAFKVYLGSAEVDARLTLYDIDAIGASEEAFARLRLVQPVVAAPFDRFVLRDVGRDETVGGGVVLDAHPLPLRGAARAERLTHLRARAVATPDQIPTLLVAERGQIARADLPELAGSDAPPQDAVQLRTLVVSRAIYDRVTAAIETALADAHASRPLVRGVPRDDLRRSVPDVDPRLFNEVLDVMGERIAVDGPLVRLASHHVVLSLEEEAARAIVLDQLADAGFSPPSLRSLRDTHGDALIGAMIDAGDLVAVADELVYGAVQLDQAREVIREAADVEGPLTASRIKQLLQTSRKYAIPLLEFFDASGFTRRDGDVRVVAQRPGSRL